MWDCRWIRLSEVLGELIYQGSKLTVVTREDGKPFVDRLESRLDQDVRGARLRVVYRNNLHTKGFLTDYCCLSGSMNFTHNGILRLEEMLTYQAEQERVSELALAFAEEYGS
jgi:hypothetical protein